LLRNLAGFLACVLLLAFPSNKESGTHPEQQPLFLTAQLTVAETALVFNEIPILYPTVAGPNSRTNVAALQL